MGNHARTAGIAAGGAAMLALLLATAHTAQAGDSIWEHNGSLMYYQAEGERRAFFYLKPRKGLEHLRGRLLFAGRMQGGRLTGTAYTFRKGCRPAGYEVSGAATANGGIVLRAKLGAPVRDKGRCGTVAFDPRKAAARLRFGYVRRVSERERLPEVWRYDAPWFLAAFPLPNGGGRVIVRAEDPGEPAWSSVRVEAWAECIAPQQVLVKELLQESGCDIRRVRVDGEGRLRLDIMKVDADSDDAACSIAARRTVAVGSICPAGR